MTVGHPQGRERRMTRMRKEFLRNKGRLDVERKLLLVYGTLLPSMSGEQFGLEPVEPAVLKGFEMLNLGWFPGIRPKEGSEVKGHLSYTNNIASIDRYEGEGSLYLRTAVTALTADGREVPCETYVYLGGGGRPIVSGDWTLILGEAD